MYGTDHAYLGCLQRIENSWTTKRNIIITILLYVSEMFFHRSRGKKSEEWGEGRRRRRRKNLHQSYVEHN